MFLVTGCRLEQGRFKLPNKNDTELSISYDQLNWLLSGLSMQDKEEKVIKKYQYYA